MPLQFGNVPLSLGGVDQKTSRLLRAPGTLDRAVNVVFEKLGDRVIASKRLGYQRVDCSDVVGVFDADEVWTHCAVTPTDELLLFGYRWVAGVASPESLLRGTDALVQRGPSPRGQARAVFISQSRLSQQVVDDVDA